MNSKGLNFDDYSVKHVSDPTMGYKHNPNCGSDGCDCGDGGCDCK